MTFEEFTRTRLGPLLRFATVLCLDPGLAEDLLQDVLMKVYTRWADVEQLDHPEAYVRRMVVNKYLSWRRKWARIVPVASVEFPAAEADHAESLTERRALFDNLRRLPRRQRAVSVLRYYGGLSDAEIAEELGCPAGTVRSIASRAVAALRLQLNGDRTVSLREV